MIWLLLLGVFCTGFSFIPPIEFQPKGGLWFLEGEKIQGGKEGDIAVPADYYGENKTRLAFFRPSEGNWYIKGPGVLSWSDSKGNIVIPWGKSGDIPLPGDFTGDHMIDLATFRPSEGTWNVRGRLTDERWGTLVDNKKVVFGAERDVPVPLDYFNEGKLRMAVWRPANGTWYIKGAGFKSWKDSTGNLVIKCGATGDIPVPGDYYGDGKIRLAVFRPSDGTWSIKGSGTESWNKSEGNVEVKHGKEGDIPMPYDYFGEGKVRMAVFRPKDGFWYIKGPGMKGWDESVGNTEYRINGVPGEGQTPVKLYRYN